ncbi:hypothetical protein ACFWMR_04385 [Amycolatopsis thailandensis]|uniref:hypothetical protein n=1 Tax=Amycolatopsis thailandensis TaxID=589330 RepID=UPI0036657037
MNIRIIGVVLVLGTMLLFLAEAMAFGHDLGTAVGFAGAVALVAAEVVRRGLGGGDGDGFVPAIRQR